MKVAKKSGTLGKWDKTEVKDEESEPNLQHMDLLLAHGVNRQQRHSDMSSCVWTDLLKV